MKRKYVHEARSRSADLDRLVVLNDGLELDCSSVLFGGHVFASQHIEHINAGKRRIRHLSKRYDPSWTCGREN